MKKNVLIVGAFKNLTDGGSGGQLFACKTIIDSPLSDYINWIKVDSTVPHANGLSMLTRILKGIKRVCFVICALIFKKIDTMLVFTADGFSFYEKGLICLIGKVFQKK